MTSKRNFIIIIVAVAAALVIAAVSFTAVGLGGSNSTTGLLETAMRYFSELDYEQAIIQFEKVLSIEPTNIEAYNGLVKVYIAQGDYESAGEARSRAYEATGSSLFEDAPIGESVQERAVAQLIADPDAEIEEDVLDSIASVQIWGDDFILVNRELDSLKDYSYIVVEEEYFQFCYDDGREENHNFGSLSSLEFVKKLNSIVGLDVGYNQVSDITPLAEADGLVRLDLSDMPISDISTLAGMTNLTGLRLTGLDASDLSPLSNLTNLTHLSLSGREIIDISPLSGLTSLTTLALSGHYISNISPLMGLTNLTRLSIWSREIIDISPLSGLTNLTNLRLSAKNIYDYSPLYGLKNLKHFYVHYYSNQLEGDDKKSDEQIKEQLAELQARLPDCNIEV